MPKARRLVVVITALGLAAGACDDGEAEPAGRSVRADPFCEQAARIEALDDAPTDEQWDDYLAAAPDEIRNDLEALATAAKAARDGQRPATGRLDDEHASAMIAVDAFERRHCSADPTAGDLHTWCIITADGVRNETAEVYMASAPDEIREATEALVEAGGFPAGDDVDDIGEPAEVVLGYARAHCPGGQ